MGTAGAGGWQPQGQWGLHPAACTPPEISGMEMCGDSFPSCTDLSVLVGSHHTSAESQAKLPSPCLGVAIKGIIPVLSDSESASALFPVCQAVKLPKGVFGAVIHEEFYSPALWKSLSDGCGFSGICEAMKADMERTLQI